MSDLFLGKIIYVIKKVIKTIYYTLLRYIVTLKLYITHYYVTLISHVVVEISFEAVFSD